MSSGQICTQCGTTIPPDSPRGFCAECLLSLGLNQMPKAAGTVQDEGGQEEETGQGNGGQKIGWQQGPKKPKGPEKAAASLTDEPNDTIGRYRLLQEIGHGGCGVVYLAEQDEPVRRRVALKIIKL